MRSLSRDTQQAGLKQNNSIPELGYGGSMGASKIATGWYSPPRATAPKSDIKANSMTSVSSNGSLGVPSASSSFGALLSNWTASHNAQADRQIADATNATRGSLEARGLNDSASGADVEAKNMADLRSQITANYDARALDAYNAQSQLNLQDKIATAENKYRMGSLDIDKQRLAQTDPRLLASIEEEMFRKGLELSDKYKRDAEMRDRMYGNGDTSYDALNAAITNQAVGPGSPGGFSGVEDYQAWKDKTGARREAEAERKAANQQWANDLAAANRGETVTPSGAGISQLVGRVGEAPVTNSALSAGGGMSPEQASVEASKNLLGNLPKYSNDNLRLPGY